MALVGIAAGGSVGGRLVLICRSRTMRVAPWPREPGYRSGGSLWLALYAAPSWPPGCRGSLALAGSAHTAIPCALGGRTQAAA